jgi:hypothetical protein
LRLTRRFFLRTGALAAASPLLGQAPWPATLARAQHSEPHWRHGLSLFGELKYQPGFGHFDYVNPRAPKGGAVRLAALGTFDNFNQVVAGFKGLFAADAGTICDTLMAPALDEAGAHYGLIAEAVSYPANFASTSFRLRAAARHHDGRPITVEDVVFSFEAYKKYNPLIGAFYRHVAKVEQPGTLRSRHCARRMHISQTSRPHLKTVLSHIHVLREVERFAAVRERDPGVTHAQKVFALIGVVCFFCERRQTSGRFPSGVALRSHLVCSMSARFTLTTNRYKLSLRKFWCFAENLRRANARPIAATNARIVPIPGGGVGESDDKGRGGNLRPFPTRKTPAAWCRPGLSPDG